MRWQWILIETTCLPFDWYVRKLRVYSERLSILMRAFAIKHQNCDIWLFKHLYFAIHSLISIISSPKSTILKMWSLLLPSNVKHAATMLCVLIQKIPNVYSRKVFASQSRNNNSEPTVVKNINSAKRKFTLAKFWLRRMPSIAK